MANESDLPVFKKGQELLASDLNRIVALLGKRIVGNGIVVRSANGHITLSLAGEKRGRARLDKVIARLATDDGDGEYTWNRERGPGPDTGTAIEINDTEGVELDQVVTLLRLEDEWVFIAPPPPAASVVYGRITGGPFGGAARYTFAELNYPWPGSGLKSGGITGNCYEMNQSAINMTGMNFPMWNAEGSNYYFVFPAEACPP